MATLTEEEVERKAFEIEMLNEFTPEEMKWIPEEHWNPKGYYAAGYEVHGVQYAWQAWSARAELAKAREAELLGMLREVRDNVRTFDLMNARDTNGKLTHLDERIDAALAQQPEAGGDEGKGGENG